MCKPEKGETDARQSLLFSEEDLKSLGSAEKTNEDDILKTAPSRSVIPFFLRTTREKKKAREEYIKNNFSDDTYKPHYTETAEGDAASVGSGCGACPSADDHMSSDTKPDPAPEEPGPAPEAFPPDMTEVSSPMPRAVPVLRKRGRPKTAKAETKVRDKDPDGTALRVKKSERLRKTKKRLLQEYMERYSEDIPDDIDMNLREKRKFHREIDHINEKIQTIENDDGEIENIPTELKNTYTVFRDAAIKHRLLTADEEKELSKRIQEGDEEAFNTFVEANYRLVIACSKQIYGSRGKTSILDYMDIIQEGIIGLLIAVSKFDWRHNTRFSTYGVPWIYQRINRVADSQRNGFTVPGYAGYCIRRMNEDIKKYQAGTLDETNMKQSELKRMKELSMISAPIIAIDPNPNSDPDDTQGTVSSEMIATDSVKDDSAILGKIETEHYQDRFHTLLKNILTDEEYDILCQRHGMGEYEGDGVSSLRTIADTRGKSIECVRLQIEDIEKKIRRSTRFKKLNKEWFSAPASE